MEREDGSGTGRQVRNQVTSEEPNLGKEGGDTYHFEVEGMMERTGKERAVKAETRETEVVLCGLNFLDKAGGRNICSQFWWGKGPGLKQTQ